MVLRIDRGVASKIGGRLASKIGGSWEVGLQIRWGGGGVASKIGGGEILRWEALTQII